MQSQGQAGAIAEREPGLACCCSQPSRGAGLRFVESNDAQIQLSNGGIGRFIGDPKFWQPGQYFGQIHRADRCSIQLGGVEPTEWFADQHSDYCGAVDYDLSHEPLRRGDRR